MHSELGHLLPMWNQNPSRCTQFWVHLPETEVPPVEKVKIYHLSAVKISELGGDALRTECISPEKREKALPEYQTEIEAFQSDITQRIQHIMIRKLNQFLEHRAPSLMFSLEDGDEITLDWGNIAKSFNKKKAEETASLVEEACFFILPYLRSNEFYLRLVNNLSPCEGVCIF